jgi:ubiquinone biosynthesis protein COQ9
MTLQSTAERDRLRETLLLAALPHVPFEGWGRQALIAGARDAGIATPLALDAFPLGAKEMIECFCRGQHELGHRHSDSDAALDGYRMPAGALDARHDGATAPTMQ